MLIAFIQPMMLGNALGIVLNRVSTHNLIQYECHNSTLLLNEGIPMALKGKKLCLKNPMVLSLIFEFILVIQI